MIIPCKAIGTIESAFVDPLGSARQARIDGRGGRIVLKQEYQEGLDGLEGFSHIIALYYFHKESEEHLKVKPLFDPEKCHGIFACRFPSRPNRLGISILTLNGIENNILYCSDIDMLNGTPVLDIKPYVKQFDHITETKSGWYDEVDWANCEHYVTPNTAPAATEARHGERILPR